MCVNYNDKTTPPLLLYTVAESQDKYGGVVSERATC